MRSFALDDYKDAEFQPCPKLPSFFDKKIEVF